jgi:hypothetical protein
VSLLRVLTEEKSISHAKVTIPNAIDEGFKFFDKKGRGPKKETQEKRRRRGKNRQNIGNGSSSDRAHAEDFTHFSSYHGIHPNPLIANGYSPSSRQNWFVSQNSQIPTEEGRGRHGSAGR